MANLYLRKVELEIFPSVGENLKIDELRIKFSVERTTERNPNKAKIEVYNLSDRTRSVLEKKNTRVALKIGYEDNAEIIFIGNVDKVAHKREQVDIITEIEAKDGGNTYRNSRHTKGYPPGIKAKQIFEELGDSMGLPVSSMEGVPDDFKYENGVTFSGLTRDHLDNMTQKFDLEWSIQDETLQITKKNEGTKESVVVLDADSGLVGFPAKTKNGVEFSSLIQPSLKPGRRVQLESRIVKGTFKLRKVTHDGDSHAGDFLSKCEAATK